MPLIPKAPTTKPVPQTPATGSEPEKPNPQSAAGGDPSPEDLKKEAELAKSLRSVLGLREPKPKEEKKLDEPKKDEKPAAEAAAGNDPKKPAGAAQEEKKIKVSKSAPAPRIDVGEIASAAASAAAAATAKEILPKLQQTAEPKAEKLDESGLSKDERYDLSVYKHLEEKDPKRYAGSAKKYVDGLRATADYQKQWESNNPGQKFNPEDSEHDDFFSKIEPEVSDTDFSNAEEELKDLEIERRVEKKLEQKLKPISEAQQKVAREAKVKSLAGDVENEAGSVLLGVMSELSPELSKSIEKDGAEAVAKKMQESDPLAYDIMSQAQAAAVPVVREIVNLWRSDGLVQFDQRNPDHAFIQKFALSKEKAIKSLPVEDQEFDGKKFATWQEYDSMTPAQRSRHWVLDDKHLIHMLSGHFKVVAKANLESAKKMFERYGLKPGAASPPQQPQQPTEPERKISSPSSGENGSPIDTSRKTEDLSNEPLAQKTRGILFPRA